MLNAVACGHVPLPLQVGFHNASFDAAGNLLPPAAFGLSVQRAMDASVAFYGNAPQSLFSLGLPPWVWSTFTDGDYKPTSTDIVAAMSDGLGILGYVKYVERARAGRGGDNATAALQGAVWLADYLINWATTWPVGAWPSVARSTGVSRVCLPPSACSGAPDAGPTESSSRARTSASMLCSETPSMAEVRGVRCSSCCCSSCCCCCCTEAEVRGGSDARRVCAGGSAGAERGR